MHTMPKKYSKLRCYDLFIVLHCRVILLAQEHCQFFKRTKAGYISKVSGLHAWDWGKNSYALHDDDGHVYIFLPSVMKTIISYIRLIWYYWFL